MVYNVILMKLSLFLARLLNVYSILIWVRIILSWLFPNPSRQNWIYWIGRIVDPYLKAFQNKTSVIGRLDFSPILAVGTLYVVESILQYYGYYGTITLSMFLYVFLAAFWNYGLSIYFWILFFALVFKTIASFSRSPQMWGMADGIGSAARPVTDFVRSFAKNRILSERTVNLISLALVLIVWFMVKYLVGWLGTLVLRIPL